MTPLTTPHAIVVPRPHGGYLAVSAPGEAIRLGVVGDDEAAARSAFDIAANRWLELCEAAKMREADG
jgi:hypothetical protein